MSGGINAWNGLVAEGAYETGLAYFSRASRPEELISLSWALEEGNRVFYERVSGAASDEDSASIFRSLTLAEERHKETLRSLYVRVTGTDADPSPPEGMTAGSWLEGGSPVEEALERVRGMKREEILEFAMAMEANALDRYIKMGRAVEEERSRKVFITLSGEEEAHIARMASLLDRWRGNG
jgi:rubrerythrin